MKIFYNALMAIVLATPLAAEDSAVTVPVPLLLAQSKSKEPYCDRQCFNSCLNNEPSTSLSARDYCTGQCMRNVRYNGLGLPINFMPFDPRLC